MKNNFNGNSSNASAPRLTIEDCIAIGKAKAASDLPYVSTPASEAEADRKIAEMNAEVALFEETGVKADWLKGDDAKGETKGAAANADAGSAKGYHFWEDTPHQVELKADRSERHVRSVDSLVKEAMQEAARWETTQPFLGSEKEYAEIYRRHVERNVMLQVERNQLPEEWTLKLLKTQTLGDILAADLPSREPMLQPWFRQGDASMLFAPAGVGKSWLSMCVGLAVAGGGTIKGLDWFSEVKQKVMLLDGEIPLNDLVDRMKIVIEDEWIEGLDKGAAEENFMLLSRLGQATDGGFIDLTETKTHDMIEKYCLKEKVKLLVMDNFTTLSQNIGDENAAGSFRMLNAFVSRMKRHGVSVLLVHHSNKDSSSYRGSSALAVIYDSIIGLHKVVSPKETEGSTGTIFRMAFEKLRSRQSKATETREIAMGPFGYSTREGLEADEHLNTVVQYVKHAAARGDTLSINGIAQGVNLNRLTVEKKVVIAMDAGMLEHQMVRKVIPKLPKVILDALGRSPCVRAGSTEF